MTEAPQIKIPSDLLPIDGRFGSGPSKVRTDALNSLLIDAPTYLGTSHRKTTVQQVVGRLRHGLRDLYQLPDDWEVVLGNGGTTVFWDALSFGMVENKSQHIALGEFSAKFAKVIQRTPFLDDPTVIEATPGTTTQPKAEDGVDLYALTHNETSTGVVSPMVRPGNQGIVAVDATSAAGGIPVDLSQVDCYYFAPQKCFASDGGLWVALMSPAALERVNSIESTKRWIPESIRISTAIECSQIDTTYNTPSLTTIYLMLNQVEWLLSGGGMSWAAKRTQQSSATLYEWAEKSSYATPFVANPAERSPVVGTIDIDESISADVIEAILRHNGIVDTGGYRKLGRNQLRVAMFPSIEPNDVAALTRCIDYIVGELAT